MPFSLSFRVSSSFISLFFPPPSGSPFATHSPLFYPSSLTLFFDLPLYSSFSISFPFHILLTFVTSPFSFLIHLFHPFLFFLLSRSIISPSLLIPFHPPYLPYSSLPSRPIISPFLLISFQLLLPPFLLPFHPLLFFPLSFTPSFSITSSSRSHFPSYRVVYIDS